MYNFYSVQINLIALSSNTAVRFEKMAKTKSLQNSVNLSVHLSIGV